MHILIKYTSRERRDRFFEGMHSIHNLISDKINFTVQCTLDEDDGSMNNYDVISQIQKFPNTVYRFGKSESKIHAINRDMDIVPHWDILVNFSDDMRFIVHGWDKHIREGFQYNAPDLDMYCHWPERDTNQILCTMSIIGKKYFERDRYIYHPSYLSLFCDNESQQVAKMRDKYRFMGLYIFQHLNPAYGHLAKDSMFIRQQNLWGLDEENFKQRAARNFDLPPEEIIKNQINILLEEKMAIR